MSRIGKKPVNIPEGVEVTIDGAEVRAKGPKGEQSMTLHSTVEASVVEGAVHVVRRKGNHSKTATALWGTATRLIANLIAGVHEGFEKKLELNGVGYRMAVKGKQLDLALGFSHPVVVDIPEGITAEADNGVLTITGIDKQRVGQFAAEIRGLKPVEPYKGKGFKYSDEIVRRKEGKRAVASE